LRIEPNPPALLEPDSTGAIEGSAGLMGEMGRDMVYFNRSIDF
jgi:hypothetical protein